jgi:1-phosphatidylinositol-3-phosphate 5-kinase
MTDKEQLAYALDKIHTAASRVDSLTTFNDFAPPPISTSASENKGGAGDIVQQGFSGLYSRFREAVGVGSSSKRVQDVEEAEAEAGGRTSRHSGSLMNRADTAPSASTVLSSQQAIAATDIPSSGVATASVDGRSQPPQSSKPSGLNLMTGSKSQTSSRQSLPTNATSAVVADPPVLSKNETARSRLSSTQESEGSAQRTLSRVELESHLYDAKEGKLPPRCNRDDASSVASGETTKSTSHASAPLAPLQTRHLRTPSGGSLLLSPDDIRRRPAIDRINRSRSPESRESSTDRGTAAASPISISAHNSVYHESFSNDSNSQRMRPGKIPGTTMGHEGATDRLTQLDRMRRQVLNKESWMKDDTVKECFYCQTPFSAFRRKHHCRTCGCIFDAKCTIVISGEKFGVTGSLRVCKRCLDVISRRLDGSGSEDSGDDQQGYLPRLMGFRHSKSPSAASRSRPKDQEVVVGSEGSEDSRPISTPVWL